MDNDLVTFLLQYPSLGLSYETFDLMTIYSAASRRLQLVWSEKKKILRVLKATEDVGE